MSERSVRLAPQRRDEERTPYRRVWRTAWIEALLMIAAAVAVIVAYRIVDPALNAEAMRLFALAFGLLPLGLWVLISYRAERVAPLPRERLVTVLILGALAASGIGLPLIERLFRVEDWLPTAGGLNRLIGYTLTVGITHEAIKYLVLRYSVFPRVFRSRLDGVAYAMATAVGYATVLNINIALNNSLTPDAAALRITENTLAQVAVSTIMGYCIYALSQPDVSILLVPAGLILASVLAGFSVVFRGGLIISGIGTTSSGNNAVFGLGQVVFLIVFVYSTMNFLILNADERDRLRRRPEFE